MTTYIIKASLLSFSLAVLSVLPGYALTFSDAQKLLASDGATDDGFGWAVSIYGDTAVIGVGTNGTNSPSSGSAYVFERNGSRMWVEQQKIIASDGAAADKFGDSVSIWGDTILIGANRDDDNGTQSGSAYMFVRDNAGVWRERQKLTASDGARAQYFGGSVSIFGDTALIGASRDDDNGHAAGSAYVFVLDNSGVWREQQKLISSDGRSGDAFGNSVSLFGDIAVIGALLDSGGSAYIFVRDNTDMWHEQQKLTPNDLAYRQFGESVSVSGDTAVIGAGFEGYGNYSEPGAAYVFVRDGSGLWSEQQKLTASDGVAADRFGGSVSISGDTAVIGAYLDDDNGRDSGSAYIFVRDDAGIWHEQQKLSTRYSWGDWFGVSVSISGDTAVIGANFDDDKGEFSGSAYVYEAGELTIEKLINNRERETPATAAQLLADTHYRAEYKVTNNGPNRLYEVQVFEGGKFVCDLYGLKPGESKQKSHCASNQDVLLGSNNIRASVTAKVSGSSQVLSSQANAYYNGLSDTSGELSVTHYVNNKNADTQAKAVEVNGNEAEVLFRVENTGSIELYRINTFHDPASPVNSGWQQQCFIGTLVPGQVRHCKRTVSVTKEGLNKAFGRVQGKNANVSATDVVNASNPTYFNVELP